MKRTKALLFLTLALCAALLTGCRSNVPNTTDGRVDGTEPSALIPTAASEIMTEPSAATEDSSLRLSYSPSTLPIAVSGQS